MKNKAADWAAFSFFKKAQIWSTRPTRYSPVQADQKKPNWAAVLPDRVDDFQPKSSPKPTHFNKNQPKILTAKIMWYDFITMSIKINKDHFYLLKIK